MTSTQELLDEFNEFFPNGLEMGELPMDQTVPEAVAPPVAATPTEQPVSKPKTMQSRWKIFKMRTSLSFHFRRRCNCAKTVRSYYDGKRTHIRLSLCDHCAHGNIRITDAFIQNFMDL